MSKQVLAGWLTGVSAAVLVVDGVQAQMGARTDRTTTNKIHFAAVSDQHYGHRQNPAPSHDADTIADWMEHPDLPPLDFVVASFGDWISDHRLAGDWSDVRFAWEQIARRNADQHRMPYFFVIGNHDITNYSHMPMDSNPVFKERLGRSISGMNENNYAFMYDNVLFICAAQTNTLYHLSNFQKDWLEYLTTRFRDHTTVIWSHQAIYETTGAGDPRSTSWTTNDYRVHNDITWWRSFLDQNPQIVLYIHGHNELACDTIAFDLHPDTWDDNCTFVLVPSNGKQYGQDDWSYVFTVADDHIGVKLWSSRTHAYVFSSVAGVPYVRHGDFGVSANGLEWLSVPKRTLNGQRWTWANRMVARRYVLELVGTDLTEQIDNPTLDGCHESDEEDGDRCGGYWYAVRGDEDALNHATGEEDGYIAVPGGTIMGLAASDAQQPAIEGHVPYNTAIAVPEQTYTFAARIKSVAGLGSVDYLISIPRYLTLSEYVWYEEPVCTGVVIGPDFQTVAATFTVPDDPAAWFVQPKIRFNDPNAVYIWDNWSLQMLHSSDVTEDFAVKLNGRTSAVAGPLPRHCHQTFVLPNTCIENTLHFACAIQGNRVGMVRLIYEHPRLWSDDVSFGIQNEEQTLVYLEDVSPYNTKTSVMSFDQTEWGMSDPRLRKGVVRGKMTYSLPGSDESINGIYALAHTVPGDSDEDRGADLDPADMSGWLGAYGADEGGDIDGERDSD